MATQKFYVTDATSRRYMHYTFGKDAKLDPDIEAINNELMPYWDSFNEAFKPSTLTLTLALNSMP